MKYYNYNNISSFVIWWNSSRNEIEPCPKKKFLW